MKRIIVTGANSMIGVALIKYCSEKNVQIVALVRPYSVRTLRLKKNKNIDIIECELDCLENINLPDTTYDVFFHLGWAYISKEGREQPDLQERNIKYTLDAVRLAAKYKCKKFIGAGSQAEYGVIDGIITDDTPLNPTMPYGISKYAAGLLSRDLCYKYGIIHIWARIFSVYGRNDHEDSVLSYAIEKFKKKEIANFSTATQMWNYLHETDAGIILYLLGEKIEVDSMYRIAGEESKPLREYINQVAEIYGNGAECHYAIEDKKKKNIGINPDVGSLFQDIDFTPIITFKEGIKDIIEYTNTMI